MVDIDKHLSLKKAMNFATSKCNHNNVFLLKEECKKAATELGVQCLKVSSKFDKMMFTNAVEVCCLHHKLNFVSASSPVWLNN